MEARAWGCLPVRSGPHPRAAGARPPLARRPPPRRLGRGQHAPRPGALSRGVWVEPGHATARSRSASRFRPRDAKLVFRNRLKLVYIG